MIPDLVSVGLLRTTVVPRLSLEVIPLNQQAVGANPASSHFVCLFVVSRLAKSLHSNFQNYKELLERNQRLNNVYVLKMQFKSI